WDVIRAAHSLHPVTHPPLADHTPQEVTAYLEKRGRPDRLTDWQYRQIVAALQQALCLAGVAWAPPFDWADWNAAARPLPASPPPSAREVTPPTRIGHAEPRRTHGGDPAA